MDVRRLQRSPSQFRDEIQILTDDGPVPFGKQCEENWQFTDFRALDPGWMAAVGQQPQAPPLSRAWLERPRGHSKTSDIALMTAWALFASRRPLKGVAAAVDKDQAKLVLDAVNRLLTCNPWLSGILETKAWSVVNRHTGATLDVIAADTASSWGLLLDFVVLDEVCHWPKRDLFDSLMSSAAKRKSCMVLAISNAGFLDSWQWTVREQVRDDASWYFSRLEGPQASWIDRDVLAEQERLLPRTAFERLWLNQWSNNSGDVISPADLAYAFRDDLGPLTGRQPHFKYCAGVDLGVSRDASAVVMLAVDTKTQRVRLGQTRRWLPTKGNRVDLLEVAAYIDQLDRTFGLSRVSFDPWQSTAMISLLEQAQRKRTHAERHPSHPGRRQADLRFWACETPATAANLREQASVLIQYFSDRRLDLYQDEHLRRDLQRLRVQETSYGFRLTSPRDEYGHGDSASAFALALQVAVKEGLKRQVKAGGTSFGDVLNDPFAAAQRRLERTERHEQFIASGPREDQGDLPLLLAAMRNPLFRV